jgi:hypothetical protein
MKAEQLVQAVLLEARYPHLSERLAQFLQTVADDDPRRQQVEQLLGLARERRDQARADET